ncbi:MAG: glycosyltransferase family 2 protein, partial [Planctomycetes bacterium]|nr:glycosyltransferase family 2 protein [Planctomycetota bacterium]
MSPSPRTLPLTVCVITRDEAANIRTCLDAVAGAAEIVVVD